MSWLTEEKLRELYVTESATAISSAQINQCLDAAIDRLADLCGDSVVSEIDGGTDSERKVKSFRRAQGKFAYAELLFLMSSRFRDGGILIRERDDNGSAANEYSGFADIDKRRTTLIAEAIEAVKSYLTPQEIACDEVFYIPSVSVKKNILW